MGGMLERTKAAVFALAESEIERTLCCAAALAPLDADCLETMAAQRAGQIDSLPVDDQDLERSIVNLFAAAAEFKRSAVECAEARLLQSAKRSRQ